MPLVVETGDGNADANAYISHDYASDYHELRGNSKWVGATAGQRTASIVKATDYIDKRFGRWFRGERTSAEQGLEWPRIDAIDDDGFVLDGIPAKLKRACAEYALRALVYSVLAPDPARPVPGQNFELGQDLSDTEQDIITGRVELKREKVGSLEIETRYDNTLSKSNVATVGIRSQYSQSVNDYDIPAYPEADMWIEDLLEDLGSIETVRA